MQAHPWISPRWMVLRRLRQKEPVEKAMLKGEHQGVAKEVCWQIESCAHSFQR